MLFDYTTYQFELLQEKDSHSFFKLVQDNKERLKDFFVGTLSKTKTLEETQLYCKENTVRIE